MRCLMRWNRLDSLTRALLWRVVPPRFSVWLDAAWHLPREQRNLLSDVAAELGAVAWERMGRDVTSALAELRGKGAAG